MSLWRLAIVLTVAVPFATATQADDTAAPLTTGAITAEVAPTAVLIEVRAKLAERPAMTEPLDTKDKEALDQAAITEFYAARGGKTLWMTDTAITPKARALTGELKNADAYPTAFLTAMAAPRQPR